MQSMEAAIDIEAPPEEVWRVLMDVGSWDEWQGFIRVRKGRAELGARLEVSLTPPEGMGATFSPEVVRLEERRELAWLGRVGVRGLFDGQHIFRLEPAGEGRTRFVHREEFRGGLSATARGSAPAP